METAPTGDWNISTTVKKADSSIIEKPLELEGEGGSSVNYLDVTISIRRNRLRWTLYDKKKFIFIDGKALLESPNFPWYVLGLLLNMSFGFGFGFDVCTL